MFFPLFLFLLISFHPSLDAFTLSVCFSPFSFFAYWYSSVHSSLGCFHLACVLLFPFFLYLILDIHPSIHPFGCFHLVCACMFLFTFFNFASCLFSFILGCFSSIRLHLLPLPLLLRIALLLLLCCCCWFCLPKRVGRRSFDRSVF